jgi:hypothetical protein
MNQWRALGIHSLYVAVSILSLQKLRAGVGTNNQYCLLDFKILGYYVNQVWGEELYCYHKKSEVI